MGGLRVIGGEGSGDNGVVDAVTGCYVCVEVLREVAMSQMEIDDEVDEEWMKYGTYGDEEIAVGRAGARDLNGFTIRAGHGAIAVASTYTKQ